jgi:glycosyltransferase involved in cell wall biosynthesis
LKIALISNEYAGVANSGGIGTYMRNTAQMLARRGHSVEVFTGGTEARSVDVESGLTVHFVPSNRNDFSQSVTPFFAQRFQNVRFDVVEGPEYNADAAGVARAFPELPLLVKLHGPSFTLLESEAAYVSVSAIAKARFFAGSLRRGRFPKNPWKYDPDLDQERAHAVTADELAANSNATARRAEEAWNLPAGGIVSIPYVFDPPASFLRLRAQSHTRTVLFLGRLEVRKGVIELARAIPMVLRREPNVRFVCVGRSIPHPQDRAPVEDHMKRILGRHAASVRFVGGIPHEEVCGFLGESDICVFPSHWEASGFVCMEAMAAARGVVGSSAGGMAELLTEGRTGLLAPPRDPNAVAEAILALLRDPERRIAMGLAAREYLLATHSAAALAPAYEASYRRAIGKKRPLQ